MSNPFLLGDLPVPVAAGIMLLSAGSSVAFIVNAYAQWRARLREESAAQKTDSGTALPPAGRVTLGGVVESIDEGSTDSPVVMTCEQVGNEWQHKSSWHHEWAQVSRKMDAVPFFLKLDDGSRVRVEADERVVLHDRLSDVVSLDATHRRVRAEVRVGERVIVIGELVRERSASGPYRAAQSIATLRAPSDRAPLRIASRTIATKMRDMTRYHKGRFFVAAVGMPIAFTLLCGEFISRLPLLSADPVAVSMAFERMPVGILVAIGAVPWGVHLLIESRIRPWYERPWLRNAGEGRLNVYTDIEPDLD